MYLLFTYKNTIIFLISTFFSLFYFFPPFRSKTQRKKLKNLIFLMFLGSIVPCICRDDNYDNIVKTHMCQKFIFFL